MDLKPGESDEPSLLDGMDEDEAGGEEDESKSESDKAAKFDSAPTNCSTCGKTVKGEMGLRSHEYACSGVWGDWRTKKAIKREQKKAKAKEAQSPDDILYENPIRNKITASSKGVYNMNEEKPPTADKVPSIRAEASKLRGKILMLLKRYRKLPEDERDMLLEEYEVLRDFRQDLRNKKLSDEVLDGMLNEIEDVEQDIIQIEENLKSNPKSKLEEDEDDKDWEKEYMKMEKRREQMFYKRMMLEELKAARESGNPFFGKYGNSNKNEDDELIDYPTVDGTGFIKMTRKEAAQLERQKMLMKEQQIMEEERQRRKLDAMDPYVDHMIFDDRGNMVGTKRVRQSVSEKMSMIEQMRGTRGQDSDELRNFMDNVRHELETIRKESKEDKMVEKIKELESKLTKSLDYDPLDKMYDNLEKYEKLGFVNRGTDRELQELKNSHEIQTKKMDMQREVIEKGMNKIDKTTDRVGKLVEENFKANKMAEIRGNTSEPQLEPGYPPNGVPLPSSLPYQPNIPIPRPPIRNNQPSVSQPREPLHSNPEKDIYMAPGVDEVIRESEDLMRGLETDDNYKARRHMMSEHDADLTVEDVFIHSEDKSSEETQDESN